MKLVSWFARALSTCMWFLHLQRFKNPFLGPYRYALAYVWKNKAELITFNIFLKRPLYLSETTQTTQTRLCWDLSHGCKLCGVAHGVDYGNY